MNEDRMADVGSFVRALGVIYNTTLTYGPTHPVVARAIQEQMSLFETILKDLREVTLFFVNNQIRWNTTPLEAGNTLFQRIAQLFAGKGISGLTFVAGLREEEIVKFLQIVIKNAEQIPAGGLQSLLERDGIRSIRERREKLVFDADVGKKDDARGPRSPTTTVAIPGRTPSAGLPRKNAWDLDAGGGGSGGVGPGGGGGGTGTGSGTGSGSGTGGSGSGGGGGTASSGGRTTVGRAGAGDGVPFKAFVRSVLEDVSSRRTTTGVAADQITHEFDSRLLKKVDEVKRETARQIRSLENVRDVMLNEMENMKLAAILLDFRMQVLAVNESGRKIVGDLARLDAGSPLHRFVLSGKERDTIEISGMRRTAHRILSTGKDPNTDVLLVSLE